MSILEKYRVIDLTDEKGLLCTKLLAEMGAEVVRIEKPGAPLKYDFNNSGKHAISLNIETTRGRHLSQKIVKETDILVESCLPGYLDSLGLGYTELNRVNNRLIMASITPYGQTGPCRDYRSSELVASAAGGQAYVCGEPGKPPLKPAGPQAYNIASLFAANGILLAILARHTSNSGQFLDISIHECVAASLDHVLVRYFYEGVIAKRQGSLYWNNNFRIFPCREGYILLSWSRNWETLVEWLESEGLADDLKEPRWLDGNERQQNLAHIVQVLEKWTRTHTADELVETGQLMRLPWARVASIPEVVNSPQLNERGFFVSNFNPETGVQSNLPGAPVKMSATPWKVDPCIPLRGDFNQEIFSRRLGLTGEEIEELRREGVI